MAGFIIRDFKGERPRRSARLLNDSEAQIAQDLRLWTGEIHPIRQTLRVNTPSKSGAKLSIYRWAAQPGRDKEGLITAIANTTPVQLTSAAHGLTNNDRVYITNTGTALDNATYVITVISTSVFSLGSTTALGASSPSGAKWIFENGYWFHWLTDVNAVKGPIAGDTVDKTYYTGDGVPKITYSPIAVTGGGSNYPINSYTLGIPVPAAAPTATPGAGGGCDDSLKTSRAYVYTYVSGLGEEGPPSSPSAVVDVCPGQTVDLSGMSTAPGGSYNITNKRIYRTGLDGTTYQFVAEIAVATTTYADTIADEALGEIIPSTDWDAPPTDMHSIHMMPNGIGIGLSKNNVCFSVPFILHAWPQVWQLQTDTDCIGCETFGSSAVVTTETCTYIVTGTDPSAMSMVKLEAQQTCVSKNSIATMEGSGVIFSSPDGLVTAGIGPPTVVTDAWLSRDDWQELNPSSIHGYMVEGRYVGFYNNGTTQGGFIFDPRGDGLVFITDYATGGFYDILTDSLYLIIGNYIERFDSALTFRNFTWKSKIFVSPKPINMGAAVVVADSYASLTFHLYGDGTLTHTKTVTDSRPFRLPSGYLADRWEIRIEGNDYVHEIRIGETVNDVVR